MTERVGLLQSVCTSKSKLVKVWLLFVLFLMAELFLRYSVHRLLNLPFSTPRHTLTKVNLGALV